ncbi:hypothetical protein SD71_01495 [Cohnella kolymensis]|uniref:Uncharacterized protein n=1 Tax=Cohnella kolymensis TaxID=1590652 RepID=A0ABR5A9T5_9BACL|nr:hypothetical protein [Cohnella kolymensis]KIL37375.1 hypothetical protein SD71_01495 [Cohnella kolymensis]
MFNKKVAAVVLGVALSVTAAQSVFAASPGSASNVSVKKAQHSAWTEQTTVLKTQLESLRTQQKSLAVDIKALHVSNKSARKGIAKEQKAAIKASLRDLAQQMKTIHASIESLRAQKQAQWLQLKEAKKAGQTEVGVAALEQIVSLKGQIIQAKQSVLSLQQTLQQALQAKI